MALAPVPMIATRFPVKSTLWSHCAEWKAAPRNSSMPVDVRHARDMQRAGTRDQELGDVLLPRLGEHMPAVLAVVPVRAAHLLAEPDVAAQAVLFGDTPEVVQDLRLRREQLAPGGFRLEGERVEVRRHVACATGVAVVPPGAADVIGLLHDDEVHTLALQRDGHAQAGESRSDDDRAGANRRRRRVGLGGRLGDSSCAPLLLLALHRRSASHVGALMMRVPVPRGYQRHPLLAGSGVVRHRVVNGLVRVQLDAKHARRCR